MSGGRICPSSSARSGAQHTVTTTDAMCRFCPAPLAAEVRTAPSDASQDGRARRTAPSAAQERAKCALANACVFACLILWHRVRVLARVREASVPSLSQRLMRGLSAMRVRGVDR